MKKLLSLLLGLCLSMTIYGQDLPTAQQILNKYYDALGGKEKLENIKSLKIESVIREEKDNIELKIETIKSGNRMLLTQGVNQKQLMKMVFDGNSGYMKVLLFKKKLPKKQIEQLKNEKTISDLNLANLNFKSVTETIYNGKKCYLLTANDNTQLYFDKDSGLLIRRTEDKGYLNVLSYASIDGIKIADRLEIEEGKNKVTMTNTKVELNIPVDDKIFK